MANTVIDEDILVLEELNTIEEGLDRPQIPMQKWKHGLAFRSPYPPSKLLRSRTPYHN